MEIVDEIIKVRHYFCPLVRKNLIWINFLFLLRFFRSLIHFGEVPGQKLNPLSLIFGVPYATTAYILMKLK